MKIRHTKSPSGPAASGCGEIMEGKNQTITEGQLKMIQGPAGTERCRKQGKLNPAFPKEKCLNLKRPARGLQEEAKVLSLCFPDICLCHKSQAVQGGQGRMGSCQCWKQGDRGEI